MSDREEPKCARCGYPEASHLKCSLIDFAEGLEVMVNALRRRAEFARDEAGV